MNSKGILLVSVQDLEKRATELIRRVRDDGDTFLISCDGEIVAALTPFENERVKRTRVSKVWADLEELAREIKECWPAGVSAVEAVQEQRREL